MYSVDGYWDADVEGGGPLAWSEEQWKGDEAEDAGAVHDQDEMFQEFVGCVDSCCSWHISDDIEIPMCGDCIVDVTENVDNHMFEFVFGVDGVSDTEEDEFVTAEYKGLRDIDGWQRRDPWGGSSTTMPRAPTTVTPTHI